jgi:hypothetical protein
MVLTYRVFACNIRKIYVQLYTTIRVYEVYISPYLIVGNLGFSRML